VEISKLPLPITVEIIDVDVIQDGMLERIDKQMKTQLHGCHGPMKCTCEGILIEFSDRKDEHTSYPFGLHKEHTMLWNYQSIDDSFYIQAKSCQKWSSEAGKAC